MIGGAQNNFKKGNQGSGDDSPMIYYSTPLSRKYKFYQKIPNLFIS